MTSQDKGLDLAEYVLGTLEDSERERITAAAAIDVELRRRIQDWESRLSALDRHDEILEPSAALWSQIENELRTARSGAGALTVRAGEGEWVNLLPGVDKKTLLVDEARGEESYLLRMAPGATLPRHTHRLAEECLLLEGDFRIGDLELRPGDFHVAFADTDHPDVTTVEGALLFIKGELRAAA